MSPETWVEVYAYGRLSRPSYLIDDRNTRQTASLVDGKWLVREWKRVR